MMSLNDAALCREVEPRQTGLVPFVAGKAADGQPSDPARAGRQTGLPDAKGTGGERPPSRRLCKTGAALPKGKMELGAAQGKPGKNA